MNNSVGKSIALLLSIFLFGTSFIYIHDWYAVGIFPHCTLLQRLSYSFFHASFIHALINIWCFLSVIFLYNLSWHRLLVSYIIAAAAPDFVLPPVPTVGLSALCYALLGLVMFQVKRKLYFNIIVVIYISIGFLFPLVSAWLHLYSYIAGLFVGAITYPIPCRSK